MPPLIKQPCFISARSGAAAASTGIPLLLTNRDEISALSYFAGDEVQIDVPIVIKKLPQSGIDICRNAV